MKRVFLIVLDSFGIGEEPDASEFGDFDVNTLRSVSGSPYFCVPNLARLGLFQINGVETAKSKAVAAEAENPEGICKAAGEAGDPEETRKAAGEAEDPEETRKAAGEAGEREERPLAALARLRERSRGKDTTIGHWEIAGVVSPKPLPTYPNGFPEEILSEFQRRTGRGVLCNRPYSGTEVIRDYGKEHLRTGDLIVYTSADSVFQIAAHEEKVPLEELYEDCRIAREILQGEHGVGRVIARPFEGPAEGPFTRTPHRHDFSLLPPEKTMLDHLEEAGKAVIAVGKINDIFAGQGITEAVYTSGNREGIEKTLEYLEKDFEGLCFVNLVDFDMLYGHRRDVDGYARALSEFDRFLPEICNRIGPEDLLMITADHGCDPAYRATTDHTREYVPLLMYSPGIEPVNYGTRDTFADVAATVLKVLSAPGETAGQSLL